MNALKNGANHTFVKGQLEGGKIKNLINRVSHEIELKRTKKSLVESEKFYRSLYDITLLLSKHRDLDYLLATIAHEAQKLLGVRDCSIDIYDEKKDVLTPIFCNHPKFSKEILEYDVPLGEGFVGRVAEKRKGDILNWDQEDIVSVHVPGTDEKEDEMESLMAVPLQAGDDLLGVISVGKLKENFDEKDMEKLELFARLVQMAISRTKHMDDLKDSKDKLENEKNRIKKLHDTAIKMKNVHSEDTLLEMSMETAKEVFDFDVCSILTFEKGKFRVRESIGGGAGKGSVVPLVGILAKTIKNNRSYLIDDVPKEPNAKPMKELYRSALSVPIGDHGVFQVISNEPQHFDEDDLELAGILMAHLTLALDRVKHYDKEWKIQRNYRTLFENSPVSLWEEDMSQLKQRIDEMKEEISGDLMDYLDENPEEVKKLVQLVKVLDVNKESLDIYGAKDKKELKKNFAKIFGKESYEDFKGQVRAISQGENSWKGEVVNYTLDGEKRIFNMRWVTAPDHQDDYKRVLLSLSDITEQKNIEKKYRTIFESAADAIFVMKDYQFIDCNDKTLEIFECEREDIINKSPDVFSPDKQPDGRDTKEKMIEKIDSALEGETQTFEWMHTTLDGTPFYTEVSLNSFRVSGEKFLMAIVRDISENKDAEHKLKESENKFRTLAKSAPFAIFVYRDKFLYVNEAAEELTGYKEEELLDLHFWEVVHPDHREMVKERGKARIKGEEVSPEYEFKIVTKDGQSKWIYFTGAYVDYEGKPAGLGTALDISESKAMRKELQEAKMNLEQQIKERTAVLKELNDDLKTFAYSISHDLRAPIRAIKGFGDALMEDYDDSLEAGAEEYVKRIINASKRMEDLVTDILEYSEIPLKKMRIKTIPLEKVIEEVMDDMSKTIEDSGANIDIEGDLPEVKDSYSSLIQVFCNILSNALKFVDDGVKPKVNIWAEEVEEGRVRVNIEDNGIGIAEENRDKIFEIFERLHGREKFPGTGVGLAIVKRSVERIGGRVGFEPGSDGGSRFWIELDEAQTDN